MAEIFVFDEVISLAKYHLDNQITLYKGNDFTLFVRRVGFDYVEITKGSESQLSLPLMENDGFRTTTFTLTPGMFSSPTNDILSHVLLAMNLLNPNKETRFNAVIDLTTIVPFKPKNTDLRKMRSRDVVIRPGQSEFREKMLQIYQNSCVVSGTKLSVVLEAAHILPYSGDYSHHIQNGLLLRNDIHTLFDDYLLSICPESFQIVLNPKLQDSEYWDYHGKSVLEDIPTDVRLRPSIEALSIHHLNFVEELDC